MKCNECNEEKQDSDFSLDKTRKGGRSRRCKTCQRARSNAHYLGNKNVYASRSAIRRDRYREIVLDYLSEHPCVDCGESDIVVLEFDHEDPGAKSFTINKARALGKSIDELILEIKKCQVRCSNCHKRRTAAQYDWYKSYTPNKDIT